MFTINLKKKISVITVVLLSHIVSLGQVPATQPTTSSEGQATLRIVKKDPDRKRLPSKASIGIIYDDGFVCMISNYEDTIYDLNFENLLDGQVYIIPALNVNESIYIDLAPGEYELTATTNDGKSYYGIMIIHSMEP